MWWKGAGFFGIVKKLDTDISIGLWEMMLFLGPSLMCYNVVENLRKLAHFCFACFFLPKCCNFVSEKDVLNIMFFWLQFAWLINVLREHGQGLWIHNEGLFSIPICASVAKYKGLLISTRIQEIKHIYFKH